MARREDQLRQDDQEGRTARPDPATGGGPHASVPRGDRPTWRPENERTGRRGFLRAALVVLGIVAAVWLLGHAFNLWMSAQREAPAPGATATEGTGAGYAPVEPGRITPGGPASANPDPQNPTRIDPHSVDRPQETVPPPATRR